MGVEIHVVIAGVVVVDVSGRHVMNCRSLSKLAGTCVDATVLPGWVSRDGMRARLGLSNCS